MFRRACRLPHRAIAGSVKGGALLIDLRTPEEIIETPGPDGALTWDFRSDPTAKALLEGRGYTRILNGGGNTTAPQWDALLEACQRLVRGPMNECRDRVTS
ncbi:hypothetical protein EMIHUDRAFT_254706 [Emiliania huxleyi CCMP1516]|uniref:Rhodanese domain-containing protein n=2 Tax=Emiliania huxleyi TaxID=2903 RepID=A0A0D3JMT5_EMIH1|nr:hypothetical protein EMIHUDRAFT_254706 [Emiliania huxleyi CCMP1516]EOD24820.1 hypothetical protein EMIHUDRAFT_254706 [Emiliania huxleyi CCMP1516]|eukprot:XP_005777249.1 hypothetical protein EMIHUDRAFT_254706 [Emiliania huxleyi CCMP1516]